jgi:hypothetical protein
MNSEKGFRKATGNFPPAAAGAAVLVVTTMCTTLWAGPAMAASNSRGPSASPSPPAAAQPSLSLASMALAVGAVLVALMLVVLTVDYGRRRIARRRAGGRRGGAHARASGPRADGVLESVTEDPSWPGPPGPYALHPDHPSWPGGPDPAARPELALPVRVRRDFEARVNLTPGAYLAPRSGTDEDLNKP